jgi:hypothetical protein
VARPSFASRLRVAEERRFLYILQCASRSSNGDLGGKFGGGSGSRRAQVGGEVAQGEIRFVTDPADDGTSELATARTTRSSLNAHRSSMEPPPRQDNYIGRLEIE